jgi:L-fucose isomerase-like protein
MKGSKVKIGVAATRRMVFSKEEARELKGSILKKVRASGAEIVDIDDINEEGLLFRDDDAERVVRKLAENDVDGVFIPNCNFGTEHLVAKVSKAIGKPVLLWGPRDEAPHPDGTRTRDTQCGLFATGKVLRRLNVPFSYIVNCNVDDRQFVDGFDRFVRVCSIVRAFKSARILQISTRPDTFWTMISNEGELLERFGIEVLPMTLPDIANRARDILQTPTKDFLSTKKQIASVDSSELSLKELDTIVALKTAMKALCEEHSCSAVAIQCWTALQSILGIMPCISNGLLTDEGIPVVCETDLHGAISAIMLQAAMLDTTPVFFGDLTIRHPENDNAELIFHCGNFPMSIARDIDKASFKRHYLLPSECAGNGNWELKGGDITVCRFDGDHGMYSLFIGEAKGTDGPYVRGTYVWIEVPDWEKWEYKLVTGPYVHHSACIHGKAAVVLYEACRYIDGLKADLADPSEEEVLRRIIKGD